MRRFAPLFAVALAPLLGAGCSRLVRVEVVQPLALADLPADSRRLVVAIDGARSARERAIDPDIEDRLAAVVTAALVAIQQAWVELDPEVDKWISVALAVLGVLAVYAVPNKPPTEAPA